MYFTSNNARQARQNHFGPGLKCTNSFHSGSMKIMEENLEGEKLLVPLCQVACSACCAVNKSHLNLERQWEKMHQFLSSHWQLLTWDSFLSIRYARWHSHFFVACPILSLQGKKHRSEFPLPPVSNYSSSWEFLSYYWKDILAHFNKEESATKIDLPYLHGKPP